MFVIVSRDPHINQPFPRWSDVSAFLAWFPGAVGYRPRARQELAQAGPSLGNPHEPGGFSATIAYWPPTGSHERTRSAVCAARQRVRYLESTAQARGQVGERQADIVSLRDRVECLTSRNQLLLRRTDLSERTR